MGRRGRDDGPSLADDRLASTQQCSSLLFGGVNAWAASAPSRRAGHLCRLPVAGARVLALGRQEGSGSPRPAQNSVRPCDREAEAGQPLWRLELT